mgnify:CR=1 FL=1
MTTPIISEINATSVAPAGKGPPYIPASTTQGNIQPTPVGKLTAPSAPGTTAINAWADLLKSNKNMSFPLKYYKPTDGDIKHCVDMPVEVTKNGSKKWESTIMGYFIEKNYLTPW